MSLSPPSPAPLAGQFLFIAWFVSLAATAGALFIGEVMDVTGWLGGYNFQWAWASGFAAGRAV